MPDLIQPDRYINIFPVFDNPNKWKIASQRKAANKWMADIGERNYPGLKGFAQNYASKLSGVITVVVAVLGTILTGGIGAPIGSVLGKLLGSAAQKETTKILLDLAVKKTTPEIKSNLKIPVFQSETDYKKMMTKFGGLSWGSKDWARRFLVTRWWSQRGAILGNNQISDEERAKNILTMAIGKLVFIIPEDDSRLKKINEKYNISGEWRNNNISHLSDVWLEPGMLEFLESYNDHTTYNKSNQKNRDELKALSILIAGLDISYDSNYVNSEIQRLNNELEKNKSNLNISNTNKSLKLAGFGLLGSLLFLIKKVK